MRIIDYGPNFRAFNYGQRKTRYVVVKRNYRFDPDSGVGYVDFEGDIYEACRNLNVISKVMES